MTPLDALAGRLRDAAKEHGQEAVCKHGPGLDYAAHEAREVLRWVEKQVGREAIIQKLIQTFDLDCRVCDPKWYGPMADTLLALLRERLGASQGRNTKCGENHD